MGQLSSPDDNAVRGQRLATIRVRSRLTQAQFAERLGLSLRAYRNYEMGEREIPVALFQALYTVFKIDPLWMIAGPGDDPVLVNHREVGVQLVEEIVTLVEQHLLKHRRKLSPEKKGRLIRLIYEHCAEVGLLEPQYVHEMVSIAA